MTAGSDRPGGGIGSQQGFENSSTEQALRPPVRDPALGVWPR